MDSAGSESGQIEGFCEHGVQALGFIMRENALSTWIAITYSKKPAQRWVISLHFQHIQKWLKIYINTPYEVYFLIAAYTITSPYGGTSQHKET
jgi:hypothetical protein